MLKIMLTGDVHLGRKFSNYPDEVSQKLEEARYHALEKVVKEGNKRGCNILAVAGDLFDKITTPDQVVIRAVDILNNFSGDTVLVLPGNHDYKQIEAWDTFRNNLTGKMVLLDKEEKYDLNNLDLEVSVFPAPCDNKESQENKLNWIKDFEKGEENTYTIGIAHGALAGVSPDMTDSYFKMTGEELRDLNMDLWLLGHTHVPYPQIKEGNEITSRTIFNSGTPEPDGLHYRYSGQAWYIEIDETKQIEAQTIQTGNYFFQDIAREISKEEDIKKLVKALCDNNSHKQILRLNLSGRINQELYNKKNDYYREIEEAAVYARILDNDLNLKITADKIAEEFPADSFPSQILKELLEDDKALELAYELMQEVKE